MALCKNCGKEFVVHSNRHVYCSDYCRVAAHQKQKRINQLARNNTCKICGKTFNPHRLDAIFCSPKCKQLAYRERKRNKIQKPFLLKVGKLHRRILSLVGNIDISGYHLADLVEGIPSNTNETCFIVTKTGEQLYVWDQPFPEKYSFAERYTQLSPDMMFRFMDSYIHQYELRSGNTESYTMNAILKREDEACKQLKANNLKEL